jgi:hypothetical protein
VHVVATVLLVVGLDACCLSPHCRRWWLDVYIQLHGALKARIGFRDGQGMHTEARRQKLRTMPSSGMAVLAVDL